MAMYNIGPDRPIKLSFGSQALLIIFLQIPQQVSIYIHVGFEFPACIKSIIRRRYRENQRKKSVLQFMFLGEICWA